MLKLDERRISYAKYYIQLSITKISVFSIRMYKKVVEFFYGFNKLHSPKYIPKLFKKREATQNGTNRNNSSTIQ